MLVQKEPVNSMGRVFPAAKYRLRRYRQRNVQLRYSVMRSFIGIAGISLALVGCAKQENAGYDSGTAPALEQGSAQTNNSAETQNTGSFETRLHSVVRTNAGPDTAVGASTTASSGVGTATASASATVESDAAVARAAGENQNLDGTPTPAGTGAQNPAVNSKGVRNAGSSTPPALNGQAPR